MTHESGYGQTQSRIPKRTISSKERLHEGTVQPVNIERPGVDTNVNKPYRGKGF